jgi:hypothetical protein
MLSIITNMIIIIIIVFINSSNEQVDLKIFGSSQGRNTDYPHVFVIYSELPHQCSVTTSISHNRILPNSSIFKIHPFYMVSILKASLNNLKNKKVWEELVVCFPFILHRLHEKRRVQKMFYCCVRIYCSCNVYIEPLHSSCIQPLIR